MDETHQDRNEAHGELRTDADVPEVAAASIAWALTGAEFDGRDAPDAMDVAAMVSWLAGQGWGHDRLQGRQRALAAAGERWPAPVDAGRRGGLGAAQFQAALREVLLALGLDHAAPVLRDASTPLDAGDRRLLADRPPHHGPVG
ncbi:MAG: hypothetical protein FWF75_00115 [Propionibacteriaceae bacterium]|nr:hypothetical protein [Propionibacteriaceae bacterium]